MSHVPRARRARFVLTTVLAAASIAHADDASQRELRLADVIAVAVRQSPDLARARLDVDAARAQLTRAEGSEDTHLGIAGQADVLRAGATDPTPDHDVATAAVSVSRALSTGGTLSASASGVYEKQAVVVRNDAGALVPADIKLFSAGATLRLIQPILRGAGSAAFEAPIRQAEHQRDAAALTAEARARDVVVSLAQAYWQVAFAWRQLEVRKASLDLAEQQRAYTEGAIRTEKVPRSELLAVQAAIATRKQDVIAGEQDLYERSLALRQQAGLEIGPEAIAVRTEALPTRIEASDRALDAVLRGAFAHSAELAAAAASRHAAEVAASAADNAALPRLDLDVSGGPVGVNDTATGALSSLINHPGLQLLASLSGDRAFERRTERGGQAAARAALLTARTAERDAQARLAVRVTRAVQRARAAAASVALGDQAIDLAVQNVAAEQKRFELGKSTNFDVLRRQDELEQARLRQASSVADYLAARAELDGLDGAILARYHIAMP
jgi:outer membrane protein TolC